MPRVAVQIAVHIGNQRGWKVVVDRIAIAPDQPGDRAKIAVGQRFKQLMHRDRPFAVAGVIDRFFIERAFRQRADMAAKNDKGLFGRGLLDRRAGFACRRHLLGRSRGLMAEHDHRRQARRARRNHLRQRIDADIQRLAVDDIDAEPPVEDIAGDQPAPQWRFDGGQAAGKLLIDFFAPTGIDEQKIELIRHR